MSSLKAKGATPEEEISTSSNASRRSSRAVWFLALLTVGALVCLVASVPAVYALLAGAGLALVLGNPFPDHTSRLANFALKTSVVALGAAMQFGIVLTVGIKSAGMTALTILMVMGVGMWLARRIGLRAELGALISAGTAICGGSAVGAVAGALNARSQETTVALGVIFLLNPLCLLLFPPLGHLMGMSESQFGLWAALAIHDTSSVVGATMAYGQEALEVGTLIKLVRALWIAPVAIGLAIWWARRRKEEGQSVRVKIPWFIAGFLVVAALFTYVDWLQLWREPVTFGAKRLFVATLFLIGAGLSRAALREVGLRPLGFGIVLWICVSVGTALAIKWELIA